MWRVRSAILPLLGGLIVAGPSVAKVVVVNMRDNVATSSFFFDPAYIVVSRGDTVEWHNAGTVSHTTTSSEGIWNSGLLAPGGVFRRQMMEAGPHQYICIPHESFGMIGAVSVITHSVVPVTMNDNFATQSFFFSPSSITASPGDTVKWTNVGAMAHTATSGTQGTPGEGVLFDSGFMNPGAVFRWVVKDTSGVLPYFCQPHAFAGMLGQITIQQAGVGDPIGTGDGLGLRVRALAGGAGAALSFRLAEEGEVTIAVLDARGSLVDRIEAGRLPPGPHEVAWAGRTRDGTPAVSGVYYFDVRALGRRESALAVVRR